MPQNEDLGDKLETLAEAAKLVDCENALHSVVDSIAAAHEDLRSRELEMLFAWEAIRQILPPSHLDFGGIACSGVLIPAKDVGGDIYDYFQVNENFVAFFFADASGKGTGPCIQAATCRAYFRALVQEAEKLSTLATTLNRLLFTDLEDDKFVTACFGWINTKTGELEYINAGQGTVFQSLGEAVELIGEPEIPLGVLEEHAFRLNSSRLEPGDFFALFTDGWTERHCAGDEEYGEERLKANIVNTPKTDVSNRLRAIYQQFELECLDSTPGDDLTALLIQRL